MQFSLSPHCIRTNYHLTLISDLAHEFERGYEYLERRWKLIGCSKTWLEDGNVEIWLMGDFDRKVRGPEAENDFIGVRWCTKQDRGSQTVVRSVNKIVLRLTAEAPFRGIGPFSFRKGDGAEIFSSNDGQLFWSSMDTFCVEFCLVTREKQPLSNPTP